MKWWLLVALVVSLPCSALSEESEETGEKEDDSLEEELDELEEDDFPDLVGVDEEGGLMDEFALLQEEEVVFSAAKHEQDIAEAPSAITVIPRWQIENTHCTDVVCLLRQVPEVDVRRVLPMFAAVGARALTGEHGDRVLVLVDGREINHEIFGMPYWQILPVHLEEIERIEIIRGPGSALYGANAHSMVVTIQTRQPVGDDASAFLGGGERGRSSLHLMAGQQFGAWKYQLSGGLELQDSWQVQDKQERRVGRARMRLVYETEGSTSELQAGMLAPEGWIYTSVAPGRSRDTYQGYLQLSHRTDIFNAQVVFDFWKFTMEPDLPLFLGETKLGQFPPALHYLNTNLDAEGQVNLEPWKGNLLILGGNYRWITLFSDDNEPSEIHQHRAGFFVHDEQRLFEKLTLTGGIRFDYNSITPFTVSPRVAGVWRFAESQLLRLSFATAFRKPSFLNTSLHVVGIEGEPGFEGMSTFFLNNIGNEGLGNESIYAFEAGYRAQFFDKALSLEIETFLHLYRDSIAFAVDMRYTGLGIPDLVHSVMEYRNEGREVNSAGGSLTITSQPVKSVRLAANYTFRHSWYIADSEDPSIIEGGAGSRVPWERAHLFNVSCHFVPEAGPRAGVALHASTGSDLAMTENGLIFDDLVIVHSPARAFLSGFVAWRWSSGDGQRHIDVGLRAYNLLGEKFRDTQAVTRPDGVELGGSLLDRRVFFYLRGAI